MPSEPVIDHPLAPDSLKARYGGFEPGVDGPWNDVLALLLSHRSIRAYRPDPLPDGTLETLIAAAQSASSSSGLQAWSVVAVQDQARKDRLSMMAGDQQHIRDCPLFLVWLADLARLTAVGAAQAMPVDGLNFLESFVVAAVDAALAAQNAVIALESLGLGCVYIGGMRNQPEAVAAELGLPPRAFAVFGLCVGWPEPDQRGIVRPRLPQAAVLHHETYDLARQDPAIEAYNGALRTFQRSQGLRETNWTRQAARRVASGEALTGRDRLKEALNGLGFELR